MIHKDLSPALRELNNEVEQYLGRGHLSSPFFASHRPIVGITANLSEHGSALALAYSDSVIAAGATPLIIPLTDDLETLTHLLGQCHGLILSGGSDIHPLYLDEDPARGLSEVKPERDRHELLIIRLASSMCIPTLGICRGHQLLGVAYGSTLFQDLNTQYTIDTAIDHSPAIPKTLGAHRLSITNFPNRLSEIFEVEDPDELYVNSLHHQALREVKPPFAELAIASDGVNEAIDAFPEYDILAVQWHPEQMVAGGDLLQRRLFEDLTSRASLYKEARDFHSRHLTLDSHIDTPMFFDQGIDIGHRCPTRVDLGKMELGQISSSIMVAYLPQGEVSAEGHQWAMDYADRRLAMIHEQVGRHPERAAIATTAEEIRSAFARGLRAIVPAIENGYAIGEDLSRLAYYKERYGICYITLCHNGDNALCDSARKSTHTHGGLSPLGREAVREMNRLGILVDISHAGEATVKDVLAINTKPIIASHSSARSLCDHARNLTDEQIRAIAHAGGVIQVCLYAGFIHEQDAEATYLHAVDHIEHVIRIGGIEHVGIGSDFDGDGELIGCRTSEHLIRITMELLRRGYDQEDLALIWGGNFLRVLEANQTM